MTGHVQLGPWLAEVQDRTGLDYRDLAGPVSGDKLAEIPSRPGGYLWTVFS
jgi:hypothetical protein